MQWIYQNKKRQMQEEQLKKRIYTYKITRQVVTKVMKKANLTIRLLANTLVATCFFMHFGI